MGGGFKNNPKGWMLLLSFLCPYTWTTCKAWKVEWDTNTNSTGPFRMDMDDVHTIGVVFKQLSLADLKSVQFTSETTHVASVPNSEFQPKQCNEGLCTQVNVTAVFLGKTKISCKVFFKNGTSEESTNELTVTVIRRMRLLDHLFTGGVATLVAVLYINFGAAIDWRAAANIIRKPIGPAVCFVSQFLFMPLISYALGRVLFPNNHEMALGLFFTGVSPAGGASNIWTFILGGNLDLSVTMTTISTIAAFGMMPLWIFTLGKHIFDSGDLAVPYDKIGMYAIALVLPLAIGFCIQKYLPRLTRILVRILKPASTILILFIVIFATVANLYMFELFSWQIVVAGLGLPWLGYLAGFIGGKAFRQPPGDILAIAIETGIQNTGISIFLLRFTLPQPEGDLTTVVPVAVAIMTPIPLMLIYFCKLCRQKFCISPDQVPLKKDNSSTMIAAP